MKLNIPTDSSYDLGILRCNSDIQIVAIAVDLLSLPQITSCFWDEKNTNTYVLWEYDFYKGIIAELNKMIC